MIVQLYGEWAQRSDEPMTYQGAVANCQAFADRQKKVDVMGQQAKRFERTMINKGLALYVDIPDKFFGEDLASPEPGNPELRLNALDRDPYDRRSCLDHHPSDEPGRWWTDGLVTIPEDVLRKAIDAYWSLGEDLEQESPEVREMARKLKERVGPPRVEDVSGLIDYARCEQSGPVLVVEGKRSWGEDTRSFTFEDPAGLAEELPSLVALTDPQYYHLPLTGPYGRQGDLDEVERRETAQKNKEEWMKKPQRLGWRW